MKTASAESLILFNRQLASMVNLELPLPESLRRAGADLQDPSLAKTVGELAAEVERGSSFSEAVAKHGRELPEMYGALVKAGEASGNLSETLRQAAAYEEQMLALSAKLQAGMVYPAMLLAGLAGIIALFAFAIVPKMTLILSQTLRGFTLTGAELPWPTRLLFFLCGIPRHWLTYALMAPAAFAVFRVRGQILAWLGERQFRIPLWGEFVTMVLMARFCHTMGELLARGVAIAEAFPLTRKTMGNRVFEEAIGKAAQSIERGGKVSEALAATGVFPKTATWLLGAAEERGDLVPCLAELGDYYRQAAERRGTLLMRLMEPAIIVVMGLLVGGVLIGMFAPMFTMGQLAG